LMSSVTYTAWVVGPALGIAGHRRYCRRIFIPGTHRQNFLRHTGFRHHRLLIGPSSL
jgi:hypothetical protein